MEYLDKNEIVVEHEGVGYSIDYLERMYGTKYYFWLQKFTAFIFVFIVLIGIAFTVQIYFASKLHLNSFAMYAASLILALLGICLIIACFGYVVKYGTQYLVFRNNENYKKGKGHIKLYNKLASKMPEKIRIEVERSGKKRMLEPQNRQYLHQLYNGYA
jgi:hypothetical protein